MRSMKPNVRPTTAPLWVPETPSSALNRRVLRTE